MGCDDYIIDSGVTRPADHREPGLILSVNGAAQRVRRTLMDEVDKAPRCHGGRSHTMVWKSVPPRSLGMRMHSERGSVIGGPG